MKTTVGNLEVDYEVWGKKGKTILILHGWAKDINKEKYLPLIDILKNSFKVVGLDLPGFGRSSELDRPYGLDNYAKLVEEFIKENKINPNYLIGHSFGGRIAIRLMSKKRLEVEKLILIDSAGVEKKSVKAKLVIGLVKLIPRFVKEKFGGLVGSKDYMEAGSWTMRETMKKVIDENLENELKDIETETLLIWGDQDRMTPVENGQRMAKIIRRSKLIVLPGNHGLPYRNPLETAKVIKENINE